MKGHFVAPGTPTPNRGAARLRRGASERWGVWGAISWPRGRQRQIEERPGSAGALPSVGGRGGQFGAPGPPTRDRGAARLGRGAAERWGVWGGLAGLAGFRADAGGW